jgi:hypothetical protein
MVYSQGMAETTDPLDPLDRQLVDLITKYLEAGPALEVKPRMLRAFKILTYQLGTLDWILATSGVQAVERLGAFYQTIQEAAAHMETPSPQAPNQLLASILFSSSQEDQNG